MAMDMDIETLRQWIGRTETLEDEITAFPTRINIEAAQLMRFKEAKLLAADASSEAANACLQYHGGFGFAAEYDVEHKFRETRPVSGGAHFHEPDSVVRG